MKEEQFDMPGFQIIEPKLPSLFGGTGGRNSSDQADDEIKLIGATIRLTLSDLLHKDPEIRQEAREWFNNADNTPPKGYGDIRFQWICDEFGLDADTLRETLLAYAEEQVRKKYALMKKNPGPAIRMLRQALINGKKQSSKQETTHANR